MRHLLFLPWHILQLATTAKNFRDSPVIGNARLNYWGLHVWRVMLASLIMRVRQTQLRGMLPRSLSQRWHRDGFIAIPDFLDAQTLGQVREDVAGLSAPAWQCQQGDTLTQRVLLSDAAIGHQQTLRGLVRDRRLQHALRYASGQDQAPLLYLQRICNHALAGPGDPQKNLHVDTFHPTMKAWLFLDDVADDQGAFTYVPGSHLLTRRMSHWLRWRSMRASDESDRYSAKGSWRISDWERRWLGLPPPRTLAVRAGTLVIANTLGMHRRGDCARPHDRLELWAYARSNPFNPSAGSGWDGLQPLIHRGIEAVLQRRQRAAVRKGKNAAWTRADLKGISVRTASDPQRNEETTSLAPS